MRLSSVVVRKKLTRFERAQRDFHMCSVYFGLPRQISVTHSAKHTYVLILTLNLNDGFNHDELASQ